MCTFLFILLFGIWASVKIEQITYHNFSTEELANLHSSAIKGDSTAFERLSGILRSIAFDYFKLKMSAGVIKNIDDADDLANNVYLAFAGQYEKVENLENWLRRVLFLTMVNFYKKRKSHQQYEYSDAIKHETDTQNSEELVDANIAVDMLNSLKEQKKSIIRMKFWEGLKFGKIAAELGKNESAVKKMFYRTMEELKEKLE